jgi:hypothetical protein
MTWRARPGWDVYTHGGRKNTGMDAVAWAVQMAEHGAGEILLTSMDRDGTKIGFDLALTRAVSDAVGAGDRLGRRRRACEHLADGIQLGGADAVLAASIFHYGQHTVGEAKGETRHSGYTGAVRAAACGSRARNRATSSAYWTCASTATPTWCCSPSSSRAAWPAIRGGTAASTGGWTTPASGR